MATVDDLLVEGLAAQLYVQSQKGMFVWWHLLRSDVKERFRERAKAQIQKFNELNSAHRIRSADIASDRGDKRGDE